MLWAGNGKYQTAQPAFLGPQIGIYHVIAHRVCTLLSYPIVTILVFTMKFSLRFLSAITPSTQPQRLLLICDQTSPSRSQRWPEHRSVMPHWRTGGIPSPHLPTVYCTSSGFLSSFPPAYLPTNTPTSSCCVNQPGYLICQLKYWVM